MMMMETEVNERRVNVKVERKTKSGIILCSNNNLVTNSDVKNKLLQID